MAYKMGRGERIAYDARLNAELERMKKEMGFYPSLRQIAENLNDGSSTTTVYTAIHRMIKAGELSADAIKIYGMKYNGKEKTTSKKKSVSK